MRMAESVRGKAERVFMGDETGQMSYPARSAAGPLCGTRLTHAGGSATLLPGP